MFNLAVRAIRTVFRRTIHVINRISHHFVEWICDYLDFLEELISKYDTTAISKTLDNHQKDDLKSRNSEKYKKSDVSCNGSFYTKAEYFKTVATYSERNTSVEGDSIRIKSLNATDYEVPNSKVHILNLNICFHGSDTSKLNNVKTVTLPRENIEIISGDCIQNKASNSTNNGVESEEKTSVKLEPRTCVNGYDHRCNREMSYESQLNNNEVETKDLLCTTAVSDSETLALTSNDNLNESSHEIPTISTESSKEKYECGEIETVSSSGDTDLKSCKPHSSIQHESVTQAKSLKLFESLSQQKCSNDFVHDRLTSENDSKDTHFKTNYKSQKSSNSSNKTSNNESMKMDSSFPLETSATYADELEETNTSGVTGESSLELSIPEKCADEPKNDLYSNSKSCPSDTLNQDMKCQGGSTVIPCERDIEYGASHTQSPLSLEISKALKNAEGEICECSKNKNSATQQSFDRENPSDTISSQCLENEEEIRKPSSTAFVNTGEKNTDLTARQGNYQRKKNKKKKPRGNRKK